MAKSRSQNRVLKGAIRTFFGHLKGGVHDPLPCGTYLYKRLTFGLESHQASLGQTVRDSKGLEFKPNGVAVFKLNGSYLAPLDVKKA